MPAGAPSAEPAWSPPRRRLEGEDELEALAQKVAEERPRAGRPALTLALAALLLVIGGGFVTWRVLEKGRIEAVDRLLTGADEALENDKYRSYQAAAVALNEIIEDYDRDNAAAHARLAHTYAILWGEHGERDLEEKLDAAIVSARKAAPKDGHTVAADALHRLYGASDRSSGARAALDVLQPHVQRRRERSAPPDAAYVALGIALTADGEYEAAFRILDEARSFLTSSVRAKVAMARAARRAGKLSEARVAFQEALRVEPSHPGALIGLVQVRLEQGHLGKAAEDLVQFQELQSRAPKDISTKDQALAWYVRSELARSAGNETEAEGAYGMATQLDASNPDFPFALGRWLLEAERPDEALEYLTKAAEMEPERYGILVELAEAEMLNRDFEAAERHIEAALAASPSFVPAKLARARLMRRTGAEGAVAYLEKVREAHPTARFEVGLELGRWYRARQDGARAQEVLEATIEQMGSAPRRLQGEVFLEYGRVMEAQGQATVAENAYEQAATKGKLEGWYRLAALATRQGDAERARTACERYLSAGTSRRYSESAQQICR